MKLLNPASIIDLPITDPGHVAKQINWWRQYKEVNRAEQKRRSIYMQVYRAAHKNK
jgi:hypothetical protein